MLAGPERVPVEGWAWEDGEDRPSPELTVSRGDLRAEGGNGDTLHRRLKPK